VVYLKDLLEKEKIETGGCTTGSKNMDSMSGTRVGVAEEEK
jgi:hypothetical protein